jgi:hypothetical protein
MSWHWKLGLAALALAASITLVAPAGGGGFGGGGFGRGNNNSANAIRQLVTFTDEEWIVIQPRLQKVLDAQAALGATNNRSLGRNGGGGSGMYLDPVVVAQQELSTALQDESSTTEVISAKLKALRDARVKAKENLAVAQEDLKKVLTIRQEAMLVNMGFLE